MDLKVITKALIPFRRVLKRVLACLPVLGLKAITILLQDQVGSFLFEDPAIKATGSGRPGKRYLQTLKGK